MAKRGLFTLADEEFADFVHSLGKSIDKEGIPYIFVGGTAVQLHMLKRMTDRYGADIHTLNGEIRLQDYLRATDDIDLALSSNVFRDSVSGTGADVSGEAREIAYARRINSILESVCDEGEKISPSENHILRYTLARRGVKRPVFNIHVDGQTSDNQRIMLNIGRKPEDIHNVAQSHYQEFVESGERIVVPYTPTFSIEARVIPITPLLATKSANFRPKDVMDIQNLTNLMRRGGEFPKFDEIERIMGKDNAYNYIKFLSLIDITTEDKSDQED